MLDWWHRNQNVGLLILAVIASFGLLAVKVKFDVPNFMKGEDWATWVACFQSKDFEDVAGDLLTGFIAACFFYLLVEFIPRHNSDRKARKVLSTLLSSVVETFLHGRVDAHADPLSEFNLLRIEDIESCKQMLADEIGAQNLLSLAYIAKWSYPRFNSSLQLTMSLGIDHAELWMEITECVSRLNYYSERAGESGLIGRLRLMVVFGMVIDETEMDEDYEWSQGMKQNMKKLLGLAQKWHEITKL